MVLSTESCVLDAVLLSTKGSRQGMPMHLQGGRACSGRAYTQLQEERHHQSSSTQPTY